MNIGKAGTPKRNGCVVSGCAGWFLLIILLVVVFAVGMCSGKEVMKRHYEMGIYKN